MEKKFNLIIWIIGIILTAILSVGSVQLVSFGSVKKTVEQNDILLKFISKDYMPAWYGASMIKLMNLHTEKVIAVIKGANEVEIKKIDDDFEQTIKIIENNFIQMRGGMTDIQRNLNNLQEQINQK